MDHNKSIFEECNKYWNMYQKDQYEPNYRNGFYDAWLAQSLKIDSLLKILSEIRLRLKSAESTFCSNELEKEILRIVNEGLQC